MLPNVIILCEFRIHKFINEYLLLLFTKIGKQINQNSKRTQKSASNDDR